MTTVTRNVRNTLQTDSTVAGRMSLKVIEHSSSQWVLKINLGRTSTIL